MLQDYDGATLVTSDGEQLGTIERTYVDDTGEVRFVEVKIGSLFAKHRLVPADEAEMTDSGLTVPYSKATVMDSPDASSEGDTVEGTALDRVRAYYAGGGTDQVATDDDQDDDQGDDPDDDQVGAVPVGRGDTAESSEESPSEPDDPQPQPAVVQASGDVIDVPIIEEEVVKRPVVKEVLRIHKRRVGEQQTVEEDVRKEDIEVIPEGDVDVSREGDE